MIRTFTLEEALANPFQHHWTDISVHEVVDGYCVVFTNRFCDVSIESDVSDNLAHLLGSLMYMICYGRSVSQHAKTGLFSIKLIGQVNLQVVEKNHACVILGNTFYHGVSGRFAFGPNLDWDQVMVMPSYKIGEELAEMLLSKTRIFPLDGSAL